MKNYKELIIWQKGIEIVKKIYKLVKQFPTEEKYGLVSQMTRAAVSISANIPWSVEGVADFFSETVNFGPVDFATGFFPETFNDTF